MGLTVSIITAVLLYFFIHDLELVNRNSLNTIQYEDVIPSVNTNTVDNQQQEQHSTTFEDIGVE